LVRQLSSLQVSILITLTKGGCTQADLIRAHYGQLSRQKERKRYQAAFSATSRAIVRLENREMVQRWTRMIRGKEQFMLLPAGREAII
jgi:hypothetical protein